MPTIYHKEIRSITLYSDNIEVPHGDTLLPMSEAENQQWYSRLNEGTLMQWSITRGGNKSIIASRKFYDNDTIKAVLEMRLDYEKVLGPFMSQITDNTGGMIQDETELLFMQIVPWIKNTIQRMLRILRISVISIIFHREQ